MIVNTLSEVHFDASTYSRCSIKIKINSFNLETCYNEDIGTVKFILL